MQLQPGTTYEIKLDPAGFTGRSGKPERHHLERNFPVGTTVTSSSTLNIKQGGTPGAYRLYTAAAGGPRST